MENSKRVPAWWMDQLATFVLLVVSGVIVGLILAWLVALHVFH
jgi:hypothetical protein